VRCMMGGQLGSDQRRQRLLGEKRAKSAGRCRAYYICCRQGRAVRTLVGMDPIEGQISGMVGREGCNAMESRQRREGW
jgi:hypothetical protein